MKKMNLLMELIFLHYVFLILNLFYGLGNNMAISMDEEEFQNCNRVFVNPFPPETHL